MDEAFGKPGHDNGMSAAAEVPLPPESHEVVPLDSGTRVSEVVGRISSAQLFRDHARWVATFLSRFGVPPADLDDLVQEVFLVVHRKGGFVVDSARPTTWLAAIALRVLSTSRRSHQRRRIDGSGDIDAMESNAPSPHDRVDASESLERVEKALAALDPEKRAVFILFELEGESCEQIARVLGVPLGTVHSRLFNARQAFRKAHERLLSRGVTKLCGGEP
jgi:RNA polymerase sigma-70 factor (ECF subfamily)